MTGVDGVRVGTTRVPHIEEHRKPSSPNPAFRATLQCCWCRVLPAFARMTISLFLNRDRRCLWLSPALKPTCNKHARQDLCHQRPAPNLHAQKGSEPREASAYGRFRESEYPSRGPYNKPLLLWGISGDLNTHFKTKVARLGFAERSERARRP